MPPTDDGPAAPTDLVALARSSQAAGPAWTWHGDDLNANLLVFDAGAGVGEHVNAEVEVLVLGVDGRTVVTIDERRQTLTPGQVVVIPRGARRAIQCEGGRCAYLTCHGPRAALWPRGEPRPGPAR